MSQRRRNHVKAFAALCCAAALLLLSACAPALQSVPSVGETVTFTDAAGETVYAPVHPQKVAVLFSSYAQVWQLAGGEIAVTVGESVQRGFAPENAVLVDGGAGKSIDVEALLAAQPDFVICSADIDAQLQAAKLLRESNIPTAAFSVECFDDYLSMLHIFTNLTDNEAAYQTYGVQVQQRIQALLQQVPQGGEQKKILFIRAGSGASYTKAKTADDHFAAQMLGQLGAINIADSAPVLLDGLSFEEVLTQDPDCIFISLMGDANAAQAYMDSVLCQSTWQSLRAVREGHCYYLPKELFLYKPNSRWDEAYSYLWQLLQQS